jgi:hypothetical protein
VSNFRAEYKGGIRSKSTEDFMSLKSVQYNFTDIPARFFYIAAKKKGIPAKGIHIYRDQTAVMLIKMFGLFTLVNARGKEMNQGETGDRRVSQAVFLLFLASPTLHCFLPIPLCGT